MTDEPGFEVSGDMPFPTDKMRLSFYYMALCAMIVRGGGRPVLMDFDEVEALSGSLRTRQIMVDGRVVLELSFIPDGGTVQ